VVIRSTTQLLSGWGGATQSTATVDEPRSHHDVLALMKARCPGRVIARGAGRSYGDAALNAGGHVVDLQALRFIGPIDPDTGLVTVGAGATIGALVARSVPLGWMLPVVPGTSHVTIGGAIASDVHGKNHRTRGSFAASVVCMGLVTGDGPRIVDPDLDPELFWATTGGMGLTGIITAATLRLVPLPTPWFDTVTWKTSVLGETLRMLDRTEHEHAIAWIDPCAPIDRIGRGVVTSGQQASGDVTGPLARRPHSRQNDASSWPAVAVMRPATARVTSFAMRMKSPPGPIERIAHLDDFLFPFDRLSGWNRLFGPRGLIQWQGVIPRGSEEALLELLAAYRRHSAVSTMVSLKRFGQPNQGPLSFPIEGWTVAMDLPAASADLGPLLERLDAITVAAGGRVYLAKDSRLRPQTLQAMYPRLDEWRDARRRADPGGLMCSDLARRLWLIEGDA
jgi:decaprenylphospho-beta-D-ribofuranose 2-oxidase